MAQVARETSRAGQRGTLQLVLGTTAWGLEWKIELRHIQPGRPMQNGHVESFHGRLREECLRTHWFKNLFDARSKITDWRQEYNVVSYCPTSLCC